jgi:hypothetical protein
MISRTRRFAELVSFGVGGLILVGTAAAACYKNSSTIFQCCASSNIPCSIRIGEQTFHWTCTNSSSTSAYSVTSVVSVTSGFGNEGLNSPTLVGTCQITYRKCGATYGACDDVNTTTVSCYSSSVNTSSAPCFISPP